MSSLRRAFRAACFLRADIYRDTIQIEECPSPPLSPLSLKNVPYVRKIPAWPQTAGNEEELQFYLLKDMFQNDKADGRFKDRFIYSCLLQGKPVVVKFTYRYSPELHHFCAERGHAPKLLGYGTVPGGWTVVVMEFVAHGSDVVSLASRYWTRWNEDLTGLVQSFHDKGLVHGDLRDSNFIIPRDDPRRIVLVDFDWGGEVGKAYFPTTLLSAELTGGATLTSRAITKELDDRVLRASLEKWRPGEAMVEDS